MCYVLCMCVCVRACVYVHVCLLVETYTFRTLFLAFNSFCNSSIVPAHLCGLFMTPFSQLQGQKTSNFVKACVFVRMQVNVHVHVCV
jgi:hypothetical protein